MEANPVYQFIAEEIGGEVYEDSVFTYINVGENSISFVASVYLGQLLIQDLEAEPTGEGIGKKTVLALRKWSDQNQVGLRFADVLNPDFFARFDFLDEKETGQYTRDLGGRFIIDFVYDPTDIRAN